MQIVSLINQAIPELSQQSSIGNALDKMELLKLNQLPVVEQSEFKGLVFEDKLLDFPDQNLHLDSLPMEGKSCYVFESQHFLDALKVAQLNSSDIVAVCNAENQYLGSISVSDIATFLSSQYFVQQTGATLVLSMFERDYSLAELSRLIETNNIKILASFLETDPSDIAKVLVTIKLNQIDFTKVAATFERFNYTIVEYYGETSNTSSDLDRLGSFLRYLDV
ncbi:MAG: cbs domain containing protein [Flexibacteraceae bacterium]